MIAVYISAVAVTIAGMLVGLIYTDRYIGEKSEKEEKKCFTPKFAVPITLICTLYVVFSVYSMSLDGEPYIDIIKYATVICGLALSSITDIKLKLIPNVFVLAMIVMWAAEVAVGCIFLGGNLVSELVSSLIGGLFGGGLLLIGRLFSRNGMGMGDVKIVFASGLLLKFDKIFGLLFWGLVFSLVYGLVLVITKKAKMSSSISMAPFFLSGAVAFNIAVFISYLVYGGA